MKSIFLILAILVSVNGFAAEHYIRAGSSGNGSDWKNALPALPSTLVRGDTYYIAGGSYPAYRFDDPVNGAQYITIKKATVASHGDDYGWDNTYGTSAAVFPSLDFSSNYYVVDGGKRDSWTSGYGISVKGQGVEIGGRQYITLRYVDIMGPDMNTHATGISGTTGAPSNLTFQNIYVHDLFGCPIYIIDSRNVLIEGSVFARNKSTSDWHSEGIQARGVTNLVVRYSRFINIEGTAVIVSGSGNSSNWQIYGNVFDNQGNAVGNGIIADNFSDSISDVYIYNNVFANFGEGGFGFYGGGSNRFARNNIFYNGGWIKFNGVNLDYNYYSSVHFPFAFNPGPHENSVREGSDGKYSNATENPFVNSEAGDFHLKAALPINGISLPAPFDRDPDGKVRGADGVFDIGAYEYGGGVAPSPSPTVVPSPRPSPSPSVVPSPRPSPSPTVVPSPKPSPKPSPSPTVVPQGPVKITAPADNATVRGTLKAEAKVTSSKKVGKVKFYIDGAEKHTEKTAPYTFSYDTTQLSNAKHALKAAAWDKSNKKIGETSISFFVSNGGVPSPTPTPTPTVAPSPKPSVAPSPSPSPSIPPVAGVHYIRAGATGSGSGADWTNAFPAFPASLVRGHTYYVASGSYGAHSFHDAENGQALITIKKATATDHGTSVGWAAAYGTGSAQFGSVDFQNSYYVFDGQYRGSDWKSGYGFRIVTNSNKGITFRNQPALTQITLRNFEIQGRGVDNSTHDDGIYVLEDWNTGVGITHLSISGCYIHDLGRVPVLMRYTRDFLLESCWIARNSSDSEVHAEGLSDNGSSNVIIRDNVWEDIEGTAYIVSLSGGAVDNWQIYGNVFFYSTDNPTKRDGVGDGAIGAINDTIPSNWKIYNNTFFNIQGYSSRVAFYNNGQNNEVYNNLWVNSAIADNAGSSDYNYYFNTKHNTETHSVNGSGDPFVSQTGKNFRLKAATPAGRAVPSGSKDMDGKARGADGVVDRGAYEFGK